MLSLLHHCAIFATRHVAHERALWGILKIILQRFCSARAGIIVSSTIRLFRYTITETKKVMEEENGVATSYSAEHKQRKGKTEHKILLVWRSLQSSRQY